MNYTFIERNTEFRIFRWFRKNTIKIFIIVGGILTKYFCIERNKAVIFFYNKSRGDFKCQNYG